MVGVQEIAQKLLSSKKDLENQKTKKSESSKSTRCNGGGSKYANFDQRSGKNQKTEKNQKVKNNQILIFGHCGFCAIP